MAKVVYAALETPKATDSKPSSKKPIKTKIVRLPDGSKARIVSLDADGPNFTQDLTAAFRRNVARARRENLRLFGKADVDV